MTNRPTLSEVAGLSPFASDEEIGRVQAGIARAVSRWEKRHEVVRTVAPEHGEHAMLATATPEQLEDLYGEICREITDDRYRRYLDLLGRIEDAVDDGPRLERLKLEAASTDLDDEKREICSSRCTQYLVDLEAEQREHDRHVTGL